MKEKIVNLRDDENMDYMSHYNWLNVNSQLPRSDFWVLTVDSENNYKILKIIDNHWIDSYKKSYELAEISYWQYLPTAPPKRLSEKEEAKRKLFACGILDDYGNIKDVYKDILIKEN